jgi:hypothetical protein
MIGTSSLKMERFEINTPARAAISLILVPLCPLFKYVAVTGKN